MNGGVIPLKVSRFYRREGGGGVMPPFKRCRFIREKRNGCVFLILKHLISYDEPFLKKELTK